MASIQDLQSTYDLLTKLALGSAILASVLALASAALSAAGTLKGNELGAAKDAELERFKADAATKISASNAIAATAGESAARAHERSAKLENDNLQLQATLEAEHSRRLQLQRTLLHRVIPQTCNGDKCNWDMLKPFKGIRFEIRHSPDREPEMFCGNLVVFFINAEWISLGIHKEEKAEFPD